MKSTTLKLAALGILISVSLTLFADVNLPTDPQKGPAGQVTDLLAPIKNVLSGRTWLMMEGLDPGLSQRPGSDPYTGVDWKSVGQGLGGSAGAFGSPVLQAAGGFLVPFRNPAPAFSRDILISRDFSSSPIQTEPHLAVDPEDRDHIVVGMVDYNFPSPSAYVSYDGGASWEGPNQTGYLPDDLASGGDPVLAFDRDGNIFMASISIGVEEFSVGPVFTNSLVSSIAVARSVDGGYSWPQMVSAARSGVTMVDQQIDPSGRLRGSVIIGFLDKPWMVIGPHPEEPDNPDRDVIYMAYTDFQLYYEIMYSGELPLLLSSEQETTIRLVRSEDKGITWSDPIAVGPTVRRVFGEDVPSATPGLYGSDRTLQGPRPVVDKEGNLYVAWIDSTDDGTMEGLGEMNVAHSTDLGKTFSSPVIAVVFNELPYRPRNANFRYWGSSFPRAAAGANGEIYLTYTARPVEKITDDGDVFFISSKDKGKTWTNPIRLNDDDGNSLQFFAEIDTDPEGTIHVMWADMRDDPVQTRYHIYYTKSEDGGKTWGFELPEFGFRTLDTRVTDFASNPNRGFPNGLFIGDYFAIAATDGEVYMTWADSRLGEFGGFNQKIGFARQRAIRSPDIFVSPSAGPGGESITIQGFNYQPDMNVMIQLGDATIATARTNSDGRFTTGIYIPVTGEGAQDIRVFDQSGNFASTSFYTEFGFGNVETLYNDMLDELRRMNENLESKQ